MAIPSLVSAGLVLLPLVAACGKSGEACADCLDEKCADLDAVCDGDADCACVSDCLGEQGIPGVDGCLGTCGLDARPPGFAALETCVGLACPDEGDECATPDGWSPPGAAASDDTSALVEHGGGGDLVDCAFDADLPFDPEGTTLQWVSLDGLVCVRVERRDEGGGSLANTEWTLLTMRAGPSGSVALVDDAGDLCWYSSHHNFLDWAHAWTGTVHYDLELEVLDPGRAYAWALHAFAGEPLGEGACASTADGVNPIGGPIALYPFEP